MGQHLATPDQLQPTKSGAVVQRAEYKVARETTVHRIPARSGARQSYTEAKEIERRPPQWNWNSENPSWLRWTPSTAGS